jgi:hypothetical protein
MHNHLKVNDNQSVGLTVEATRSIFRASIWAVRPDCRKDGGEDEENLCHCSFVSSWWNEESSGANDAQGEKENSKTQVIFNSLIRQFRSLRSPPPEAADLTPGCAYHSTVILIKHYVACLG